LRSGETPLVGRDEEIELLIRRWQHMKNGEGRLVLISGEPGIGKSRLTAAFAEQIGTEPHTRLRYFCSSHHRDSAHYPSIVQLEHAAGVARDDRAPTRLAKLQALLISRGHAGWRRYGAAVRPAVVAEFRRVAQPQPAAQTREAVRSSAELARSGGALRC
jgi:predicted ATPase